MSRGLGKLQKWVLLWSYRKEQKMKMPSTWKLKENWWWTEQLSKYEVLANYFYVPLSEYDYCEGRFDSHYTCQDGNVGHVGYHRCKTSLLHRQLITIDDHSGVNSEEINLTESGRKIAAKMHKEGEYVGGRTYRRDWHCMPPPPLTEEEKLMRKLKVQEIMAQARNRCGK